MSDPKPVGRSFGVVGRATSVGREVKAVGRFAAPVKDLEAELKGEAVEFEKMFGGADRENETAGQMMKRVAAQLDAEISTDYYTCLVFQTSEQRDAFLRAMKVDVEKDSPVFVSGTRIAKQLGVALPAGPKWKEAATKSAFLPFAAKPGEKP